MKISSIALAFLGACIVFSLALSGCGPTFPKEKLKESIIRLCKTEYKIDVKVRTVGKTAAIYMPVDELLDFTFALTPAATEKLNDVILTVTRVLVSTDADTAFYCIIAHDTRIPEIQVIIIKSVEDVKRFFLGDISRGEFGKRMIVDMRLSPQSQKERSIKEVFQKMNIDAKWQEQVMNDFFRSEPTGLGDIGYWNGRFYIKDITMPEFLADQIAGRIKMEFREDKALLDAFVVKNVKGVYHAGPDKPYFSIAYAIEPKALLTGDTEASADSVIKAVLKVVMEVTHGYGFEAFDHIVIEGSSGGRDLIISKDALEGFRTKKLKFEEIVK